MNSWLFSHADTNLRLKNRDAIQSMCLAENAAITTSTLDKVKPANDRMNIPFW